MKQYLTANDIVNEVRMIRSAHKGTILIVEGNRDDKIYNNIIDQNKCKIVTAYSKENTIGAVEILDKARFHGVLSVVDSDFWHLEKIGSPTSNLLSTDTHDLETMLFNSPSLDKVLSEYGDKKHIKKLGLTVRRIILDAAKPIGLLRWVSSPYKMNYQLRFKDIQFEKFLNKTNLHINIENLVRVVLDNSKKSRLKYDVVENQLKRLLSQRYDLWQVCCGHDLVRIFYIGLKHMFGNRSVKNVGIANLDTALRLSYEYKYFRSTSLYRAIRKWEKDNRKFMVLK